MSSAMLFVNGYDNSHLHRPLADIASEPDPSDDDGRYLCTVYVSNANEMQYLFVCQNASFPERLRENEWRVIAFGVEPPPRAKPWLKLNGYYQMWREPN